MGQGRRGVSENSMNRSVGSYADFAQSSRPRVSASARRLPASPFAPSQLTNQSSTTAASTRDVADARRIVNFEP